MVNLRFVKIFNISFYGVIFAIITIFLPLSCFQGENDSSIITVSFSETRDFGRVSGYDRAKASSQALQFISYLSLEVTAQDMDKIGPITISSPEGQFQLKVPKGSNRIFTVKAYEKAGNEYFPVYEGTTTVEDLKADEESVTVAMKEIAKPVIYIASIKMGSTLTPVIIKYDITTFTTEVFNFPSSISSLDPQVHKIYVTADYIYIAGSYIFNNSSKAVYWKIPQTSLKVPGDLPESSIIQVELSAEASCRDLLVVNGKVYAVGDNSTTSMGFLWISDDSLNNVINTINIDKGAYAITVMDNNLYVGCNLGTGSPYYYKYSLNGELLTNILINNLSYGVGDIFAYNGSLYSAAAEIGTGQKITLFKYQLSDSINSQIWQNNNNSYPIALYVDESGIFIAGYEGADPNYPYWWESDFSGNVTPHQLSINSGSARDICKFRGTVFVLVEEMGSDILLSLWHDSSSHIVGNGTIGIFSYSVSFSPAFAPN